MFKYLLAKSLPKRSEDQSEQEYAQIKGAARFVGHIEAVLSAAEVLTEKLGDAVQQQLRLTDAELELLRSTSLLGAYFHGLGKANQHFQERVYLQSAILDDQSREKVQKASKKHNDKQLIRHEFLSGILVLQVPAIRAWLQKKFSEQDLMLATWAAIGHHLKAGINDQGQKLGKITELPDGSGSEVHVYTDHKDFQAVLRLGSQRLGLSNEIPVVKSDPWQREQLEDHLRALQEQFENLSENLSDRQKLLVAAAKAFVISADLAGSALPAEGENLQDWLAQALALSLEENDLGQLIDQKLGGNPLRPFQEQLAAAPHRVTLVKAGCGTGKTLGAYAWARRWAVGKRLFFTYPTTGTATQGYLDYAEGSDIEKMLMHSRADLDRELLFTGEGEKDESVSARLSAFQAWRKKLVICTVDSVLGLIQNNRRPLFSWPALVQSAFVFDEVHAYDDQLFGALLRFLKTFRGAPILLMSGSFTPAQIQAIQQVMAELGEPLGDPIDGPQKLEELKRYRIRSVRERLADAQADAQDEIWPEVFQTIRNGGKVLWVTNSVQSCIEIYHLAKGRLKDTRSRVLIYHSRFRYKDRVRKHEQIIQAFKEPEAVLAVTTQVCEMSLDLSADLLVSAIAPAAALIQRLGRLNRWMTQESEGARPAIFYEWNGDKPYSPKELETGRQLLRYLEQLEVVSQRDLANAMVQMAQEPPKEVPSAWLDLNWCTYPDFLREGGYTITVLLGEDMASIQKAAEERRQKALARGQRLSKKQALMQEAQAWAIPIRIPDQKVQWWAWRKCGFYFVTPQGYITYSEEVGTP